MKTICGTSLLVATAVAAAGFTTMAMAQDECSTAVTVTVGTPAAFDTATATASADPAPSDALCTGSFLDWGTANPDVWFKFTPAEGGIADFSTCTPGAANGDTSMALYTGSCGALTQVACNGDAPAEGTCQQYFSKIAGFAVTGGTTYYVRIGGWNATTVQASLTVSFTPNSSGCAGATGDCRTPHGGVGCNDAVCCTAVCAANPLCCDPGFGWDAQCVQDTVAYCGFFIYSCTSPAYSNDCATGATVFSGDTVFSNVDNTNANTDGPTHSATTCGSGNDVFLNDRWYRFQAVANGTLRANTCNASNYDTKLAVYNMGTNPAAFNYNNLNTALVGCNDDGDAATCNSSGTAIFPSDLSVGVTAGNWYLIRLATYDVPGLASLTIDVPEPCALGTPTGTEGENCGEDTNGGCNATIPATTSIAPGQTIAGTFWADNNTRDTDWYSLSVGNGSNVTVTVKANSFNRVLILGGACGSTATLASSTSACGTVANACLNAGSYYIFVGPADAAGNALFNGLPCGSGVFNDYTIEVTSAAAQCPTVVTPGLCADGGPNSASLNSSETIAAGIVRCAAQPAFPNCAAGYSTNNSYARTMNSTLIPGGQIQCVRLGLYSVRRGTNAAGTACGLFLSDLPLPATVGIYKDTDGAAPRLRNDGTNGGDLSLIDSRPILMAGQAAVSPVNYDPPLCIADAAGSNIVVVIDFPSTQNGDNGVPANAGYQMLVAGNSVDAGGSQTYCQLGPCSANPEFVLTETLGATFVTRWYVQVNGDFSACDSGNNCPADLNGDNIVNAADLAGLLGAWGTSGGDLNGDGTTNAADLAGLLGAWGACP
jgi:hypothetical protein